MASYGQFCPVSKVAEVLCERWSLLVVRELLSGTTRFRDLQLGLPGCPPATLSKRLKELVAAGVARRLEADGQVGYEPTEAGRELAPMVDGLAAWGQRWLRSTYGPEDLSPELLLWNARPFLDPAGLGPGPVVVQVEIRRPGAARRYFWMVLEDDSVDLCLVDPGRPVDVVVDADLRALTRVWMGDTTFAEAAARGDITTTGPKDLAARVPDWFGRHPFLADIAPAVESHVDLLA
ncbi:MAG: winged helix-turn-helix transcriptional regulator [Acidimicrobiia bacterium]